MLQSPACQKHALISSTPNPHYLQYIHMRWMVLMVTVGPLYITTCTLEFPKKFQEQFIVCEHLFRPIILGLEFSHNCLIGIDRFSTKQLHLHQGPWSIIVSDPTPFPLHINQISTLLSPHILVETISQVTIPTRALSIVPTIFTSIPTNDCYYSLTGIQSTADKNLFVVPLLKIFCAKLPINPLCTIINTSPNNVGDTWVKWPPLIAAIPLYTQHPLMR